MDYRVENKYLITEDMIAYLEMKFQGFMEKDSHGNNGTYLIRSLYFDDMNDSCMRENEDGYDNRAKYRIRTYDNDLSLIHLEEKSKKKGYTHKEQIRISEADMRSYMDCGDIFRATASVPELRDDMPGLQRKLYADIETRLMHPVVIVEYERTAYIHKMGNVRITFDRNIGASDAVSSFDKADAPMRPILPAGTHILEVKYDELLPDHIKDIIDTGRLQRISYSKYYSSRENLMRL